MDAKHRKLILRFSLRALISSCSLVAVVLAVLVTPAMRRHHESVNLQRLGASVQYGDSMYPSFVERLLPSSYCRPVTKVSFLATKSTDSNVAWRSDHGVFEGMKKAHVVEDLHGITDALRGLHNLQEVWLWSENHEHMALPLGRALPGIKVVLIDGGFREPQTGSTKQVAQ